MSERADLSAQDRSMVLRPGIRTYKPRRTRISERESTALIEQRGLLIPAGRTPLDFAAVWGPDTPVVLEIGFGTGTATVQMAAAEPATGILAVDVHTPGVGGLLWRAGREEVRNVRVVEGDGLAVLEYMVPMAALDSVRSYFPDPWPKARHHKRRLVQPSVLRLVASRLRPGGTWHLATDWSEYAESMQEVFAADPAWQGGVVERPAWRPTTHYESRALREGRRITDLEYRTVASIRS